VSAQPVRECHAVTDPQGHERTSGEDARFAEELPRRNGRSRWQGGAVDDLRDRFSLIRPFDFSLVEIRRFPATAYLHPEPSAALTLLTQMLANRWPGFPPYGGLFTTVIPPDYCRSGDSRVEAREVSIPRPRRFSGEEVDEQLIHAFGLIVMDPMGRVGKALDAVEMRHVRAVGLREFGAEVRIAVPPDHQRGR
jgi:hypothetical protein